MPRFHRLAGAVALALGCAGAAQAQDFSGLIVFGDSLSDAGNVGTANGLPPGSSFTTNPDPVFAEIIAAAYGLPGANSLANGPNFAWGGACVNATGLCLNPVPNIPTQITQYLSLTGGVADPDALYSIWGGANDIFAALTLDPANAQARTVAAATAYVQQIGRLQAAGANYIVVYNLPNLGATPQFAPTPNAASVTGITYVYNTALNTGLAQLGDGIIAIDTFGLINELMANPSLYGFSNVTGMACSGSSIACYPAGTPVTYPPGTNETYLFADGVHPTGAAHAILANVVMATIAAPVQVSYAGEGGLQLADSHGRAMADELQSDFQLDRDVGTVRGYATVQYGEQDFDGGAGYSAGNADVLSLTVGANHRIAENAYWGFGITLGNHDNDLVGANIDSKAVIASLGGALRFGGGGYVSAAIGGGSTDIEFDREIVMGPTTRHEGGSTSAGMTYAELGLGWLFGDAGGLQHGPFVGGTWVNQEIDGFMEDSGDASSMNFDGFDRDSMVTRIGYQLMGGSEGGFRPYLRVAHNDESEDDVIRVNAGSNTMNGRFTMDGFQPSQDWISADLGANWRVGDATTVFAAYRGRFGDDGGDASSLSLGLRMTF